MRRVLKAAFRGLREAGAAAAEGSRGRRGRIAGICIGALSGGRHFAFGAFAGFVIGALVDAYFERRAALDEAYRDGTTGGRGEAPGPEGVGDRVANDAIGAAERARLYALFGLDPGAPPPELKRAYRRLCRDLHPDRAGGSEEGFRALKAAYDRLLRASGAEDAEASSR